MKLPKEIGRLKKLKKLNATVGNAGIKNPDIIAEIENLEHLEINYSYLTFPMEKVKSITAKGSLSKKDKITIQEAYPYVKIQFSKV